jgi:hypothetical protein
LLLATGGNVDLSIRLNNLIQAGKLSRNTLKSLDELFRTGAFGPEDIKLIFELIKAQQQILAPAESCQASGGRK